MSCIRRSWLSVLLLPVVILRQFSGGVHSGEVVSLPLGAPLFEDAGEDLLPGLVVAALLASEFGLGGDEAPSQAALRTVAR